MAVVALCGTTHLGMPDRGAAVALSDWSSATAISESVHDVPVSQTAAIPYGPKHRSTRVIHATVGAYEQLLSEHPGLVIDAVVVFVALGSGFSRPMTMPQEFIDACAPAPVVVIGNAPGQSQYEPDPDSGTPRLVRLGIGPLAVLATSGIDPEAANRLFRSMPRHGTTPQVLSLARKKTQIRRPWTIPNPGAKRLDSAVHLSDTELSRAAEWWFKEQGVVTDSWEDFAGRAEWFPTMAVDQSVPRTRDELVTWVVERTPERKWTPEDIASLLRIAEWHRIVPKI